MKSGNSKKLLVECLSHLLFQSFKDFEIVISDQSENSILKEVCSAFSDNLDIKYFKNTNVIKNAANNVNFATSKASGEIIKLLYMDDFFIDQQGLEKIYKAFQNNSGKWLIGGFTHCDFEKTKFFNTKTPWYGNKYVNGDNTTGNPSTYAVRRECLLEMDENLLWIPDGEYFYRSYFYYGDPIIIPDILFCFRDHPDSAFNNYELSLLHEKEKQYCIEKFQKLSKN